MFWEKEKRPLDFLKQVTKTFGYNQPNNQICILYIYSGGWEQQQILLTSLLWLYWNIPPGSFLKENCRFLTWEVVVLRLDFSPRDKSSNGTFSACIETSSETTTLSIPHSHLPTLVCVAVSQLIINRDSSPVSPYSQRTLPTVSIHSECILKCKYDSLLLQLLQKPTPEILPDPLVRGTTGRWPKPDGSYRSFYVMTEYCSSHW